ncbi:hypothetical protein [Celeribacter halophilus]|uniref:hypothetical protein n=1 Tax=Celeribacter halophilus TaxID=576117 RepID=UPI002FD66240
MRSATHATFGDPAEVITVTETDTPAPQTGEVLVRTILSAIHNHDLWRVPANMASNRTCPPPAAQKPWV